MGWARGEIMNIVNEISVIQKMFEALLHASTMPGSKEENKQNSCPQGAHRQVGEADQCMVNATSRPGMVLWRDGSSGC